MSGELRIQSHVFRTLLHPIPTYAIGMKTIGGIIAWLGGMAGLLGGLFYLMSLKNPSDLAIWSSIGLLLGGFGILMMIAGGIIYLSGKAQGRNQRTN